MNPIAGAIITAISAISSKKQNEAQNRLAAYRESQLKSQDDLKFAREKELAQIKAKNSSSKSSSSVNKPSYQQEIIVAKNQLNNTVQTEKGITQYPALNFIPEEHKNKAMMVHSILSNEKVPKATLLLADKVSTLMANDNNFSKKETVNTFNELALLEPELLQKINKSTYENKPVQIKTTEPKKGSNWFSNLFYGEK